jgi:predicted dehydrogenase
MQTREFGTRNEGQEGAMDRRTFLAGSLAAGAARMSGSANDRIEVGVIGIGGRGRDHIAALSTQKNCHIAAVADIDESRVARGQKMAEERQGSKPEGYSDLRRLLDDKRIDVVSVATCNHWHALATIWACQAGKDVYVEKPASHNIVEGRRMVQAARRYGRMVQCGMQAHSLQHYRRAVELLGRGGIGKLYMAKSLCYKRRKSIGRKPDAAVPAGVDYGLWLGPAPERPFNPNRFHYNWHWFWDTGNGDIGNQGVHELDIARWGLGLTGLPQRVYSNGGKFIYDDDQETPNTQVSVYRFPDREIVSEVRGILTNTEGTLHDGDNYIGVIFLGSDGYMCLDCTGFKMFLGEKSELAQQMDHVEKEEWATAPHFENFLKVVRSRKREDLNCEIEMGHLSAAMPHLANTSYRLGRSLEFNPQAENFGPDREANRHLTRQYRKPFVLPEI